MEKLNILSSFLLLMNSPRLFFLSLLSISLNPAMSYGADRAEPLVGPNPPADFYSEAHRLVFFAVLEGCYADGLTGEDLDRILPKDSGGRSDAYANFVISCPICAPALDAFQLYAVRQPSALQESKATRYDTFGTGLDASVKAELAKPGQARRDAIQGLIQKWVDSRIVSMRLTEAETKTIREALRKMRERGEKALKNFQEGRNGDLLKERYKDWKACPICSGASPMGEVQ